MLLQVMNVKKHIFICRLDITKKIYDNNGVKNKLEAWLIFLSSDDPEVIMQLIEAYPEFREIYEDVYELCLNTR